jgi:cytochrome c
MFVARLSSVPEWGLGLVLALACSTTWANEALAHKQGCTACHARNDKLVGPAFTAIAERYKGQADALAQVTGQIRKGGAGRWGDVPMPPQAQLSDADVKRLATWVLAGAK